MAKEYIKSSWKEIAEMLGVSVRTAMRYRNERGMPVTRPRLREDGKVVRSYRTQAPIAGIMIWLYEKMWGPVSTWTDEQKNIITKMG